MGKDKNVDLDTILAEINTNKNNEASKNIQKPDVSVTSENTIENDTAPKQAPSHKKSKNSKKQQQKSNAKIHNSFAQNAKIINEPVDDEETTKSDSSHCVKFISVETSEVIDDPIKLSENLKDNTQINSEITRENNPNIKKIRKKMQRKKMTKRQKRTAVLGTVMTFFFIIGLIASIISISGFTKDIINNTAKKEELAKEIFPFVIIDIPEFDNPKKLDNSAIVSSAIWEFIIDEKDKSKYEKDDLGFIYVSELDIAHYIRKLYGNDVKIKHQSIDDASVQMNYDAEKKEYSIESTPKFLPYRPRVDKISVSDDIYTLKVSYILPDAMWNFETKNKIEKVDKTMQYVLKKNKDSYQILSVKLLSVAGLSSPTSSNVTPNTPNQDDEIAHNAVPEKSTDDVSSGEKTTESKNTVKEK